ncbi:MAG: glutamate--tRNA ligase [Bacteroidota bacterium]|nr:glutamate--tRNA ligase [Bacteroidota bacterium]MDP4231958.1 glutamate--tRNA ligase [Bacteroidota bacterium]MDP4241335.1 glutamate--tRNA ligase [Bacteroidota bacterium]MDP4287256.1 glutamate--tRNA ligase [Bacteroidota bacterium]
MVRVRFAPSPTGYVHVGSLRTALYCYLFARHHSGVNILRIEDTDRTRYVEGAVENIIRTMEWAGITFDEGPINGGPFGPYTQSERKELYSKHAAQLVAEGHAYPCFCTAERLDTVRKAMQAAGLPPMYDRHCRNLPKEESDRRIAAGEAHVIRMRIPIGESIRFNDLIRGDIEFDSKTIDDQVLLKSDGFPLYHLANVVDDHFMEVTHVIRGEEWLSSTPKHVLLYRAFGWEPPKFAHLPLLLNADRSKLSKRQGDVAVEDYREKGYLPQALINFVALLGWNPSATEEIFTIHDLIRDFDLERVNKGGAVFNREKLDWMNSEYIRKMSPSDLLPLVRPLLDKRNYIVSDEYATRVIAVMQERVHTLWDFVDFASYFYVAPTFTDVDEKYKSKHWTDEAKMRLGELLPKLEASATWDHDSLEAIIREYAEANTVGAGKLIHPLRLATTGRGMGPGLFELLSVLGREECLLRIRHALRHLA